jgi:hypothetical protein
MTFQVRACTRFCLVATVLIFGHILASAESTLSGLAALPSSFQGDVSDRAAGLKSWGTLLGRAVIFNQVRAQQVLPTYRLSVRKCLSHYANVI